MDKVKKYEFQGFVLDLFRRQLFYQGTVVPISFKAFEILLNLVENKGEIVEKEDLINKVWRDSFVEEANLPVHISSLRKIFKEKSGAKDFIKTVSGRGYIFVAEVEQIAEKLDDPLPGPRGISSPNPETFNTWAGNHPTDNAEALSLYIKGKYIVETLPTRLRIEDDLYQSIHFFESAVKLDPNFAEAYIGSAIAIVRLSTYDFLTKDEAFQKAKGLFQQARSLNSELSELYLLEGLIKIVCEIEILQSQKALLTAISIDPQLAESHYWLGMISMFLGNEETALHHYGLASRLSPTNLMFRHGLIRVPYFFGDFNKGIIEAKKVLEMDGRSFSALFLLACCYAELEIYDEALRYIEETMKIYDTLEIRFKRAYFSALINQPDEAEKLIAEVWDDERRFLTNLLGIAAIYSVQNKIDEAVDLLFDNVDKAQHEILSVKVDPRLRKLRNHEKFQILLKRLKLI